MSAADFPVRTAVGSISALAALGRSRNPTTGATCAIDDGACVQVGSQQVWQLDVASAAPTDGTYVIAASAELGGGRWHRVSP